MLHNRVSRIIESLKLTKTDHDELTRLVSRPEVLAILNADESEQIEHRKALIKEMGALPGNSVKAKASVEKDAAKAIQRFELAEAEYRAAKEALTTAQLACNYSDYSGRQRAQQIERELTAGSDPRISEYRHELGQLSGRVRTKMEYWHGATPKNWTGAGGEERYYSNVDDVTAARTELDNGLIVLRDLELSALTTGERTQRLKDLSHTLKGPLAKLDMHPPTLDEHGKVKPAERDGTRVLEQSAAA